MIKRQLSKIPVERGTQLSWAYIWIYVGFVVGWVWHEWAVPMFCFYAA